MVYLSAAVLGVLQGIAEFLPISSSGHVLLGASLLDESLETPDFNLAVHLGTLGSILVVYRKQLWDRRADVRLWPRVAVSTLPLVVVGLFLKDRVEAALESPEYVGFFLLLTAAFLALIPKVEPTGEGRSLDEVRWSDALAIGLFQAVAILPGVSRSGSTIFGGTLRGLGRVAAADYSFFIAIPAICGAAVLHGKDVFEEGLKTPAAVLVWGAVIAFGVGIVALKLLLSLVAKGKIQWFAAYCGLLGAAAIAWFWFIK